MNAGMVQKKREKLDAAAFGDWSKGKDPDRVAWQYQPTSKQYVPIAVNR